MLNNTHIVLRIPGFYALLERRLQHLPDDCPLLVCTGEGDRSLILSACPLAVVQGARPGMRIGRLHGFRGEITHANPERYISGEQQLLHQLSQDLPDPYVIRPGVVQALWSRGRRFLHTALERAANQLHALRYEVALGIAPGDAVAEIAASIAPVGETLEVPEHGVREFLAPQPLRLLPDLSALQLAALAEIGVHRFGNLLTLPPDVLRALLGPDGPALRRIAALGMRGPAPQQWRGRQRLGGDTANLARVRRAVERLVADGLAHVLVHLGQTPRAMLLTLCYTDGKRSGARLSTNRPEHEGSWQKLAREQVEALWTRRVRLSEVRLSVDWRGRPSSQLSLFVPAQRQFRDRELTHAVTRVRDRWGRDLVRYVV
ncbi:hypothetical protein KQI52_01655 [bacterium]|nr:hypothetical protein [bacterium]